MASSLLKNLFRFRDVFYKMIIKDDMLGSALERRKTFDSPLANHFSEVLWTELGCLHSALNLKTQ